MNAFGILVVIAILLLMFLIAAIAVIINICVYVRDLQRENEWLSKRFDSEYGHKDVIE